MWYYLQKKESNKCLTDSTYLQKQGAQASRSKESAGQWRIMSLDLPFDRYFSTVLQAGQKAHPVLIGHQIFSHLETTQDSLIWESISSTEASQQRQNMLALLNESWEKSQGTFMSRSSPWPKKSSPSSYSLSSGIYPLNTWTQITSDLVKRFPISGMIVDGTLYPLKSWDYSEMEKRTVKESTFSRDEEIQIDMYKKAWEMLSGINSDKK